jgi:hypothetical protein
MSLHSVARFERFSSFGDLGSPFELETTRPSLNIRVERAIILSCASSELIPAADWYKSRLLENSLDPSSMNCTIFPARLRAARPSRAILVENFGSLRDANLQVRVMM